MFKLSICLKLFPNEWPPSKSVFSRLKYIQNCCQSPCELKRHPGSWTINELKRLPGSWTINIKMCSFSYFNKSLTKECDNNKVYMDKDLYGGYSCACNWGKNGLSNIKNKPLSRKPWILNTESKMNKAALTTKEIA